jgi:transposase
LPDLRAKGAEQYGFRGQVWATVRIAVLIKQQFGVSYHPAHCSRLLRAFKYSAQKPEVEAAQKNEEAIKTGQEER